MYSKISKNRGPIPTVDSLGDQISGNMLQLKLEAWCNAEPSVLMWEINFEEMKPRPALSGKKEDDIDQGWRIEFNIVRGSIVGPDKLWDGVSILAGFIKNTFEMTDRGSKEAYHLSLASRNFNGTKTYLSSQDLWQEITTLGLKRNNT